MGKKKSVVLMVIISIILVALTVFTVCPSFWFPWDDGLKGWNSVVTEFVDYGSDYKGGYYAYYYPEGVITEAEYNGMLDSLADQDDKDEYAAEYIPCGSLYVSKEADFLTDGEEITAEFRTEMNTIRDVIADRYSKKGYSSYSVSVVDNFAIRVELPASETSYQETFQLFANTGALTVKLNGEVVDEFKGEDVNASDYFKDFSVRAQFAYRFIHVQLAPAGVDLINRLEEAGSLTAQGSDTTLDGSSGLWIYVGDQALMPIYAENVASDTVLKCMLNEAKVEGSLQSYTILLNSALKNGGFSFSFSDVSSEIRQMSHVYGENSHGAMLILLGVLTLAAIVAAIVLFKKYGVAFAYMVCTYVSMTGLSFAFIAAGVFEFTLGTTLAYVLGLAVMFALHAKTFGAIKEGIAAGKTVNSSVSLGYKKTLWTTVDVYVVLALAGLALALGVAGVATMAWQLLICVVAGAFNSLLWGRVINHLNLSASKDKYKYFGMVREDDDDE